MSIRTLLRPLFLVPVLALVLVAGCSSDKIVFVYPDEALDFRMGNLKVPALFLDEVTDMRPPAQREGQGKVFKITYPSDEAWNMPATRIYAEALAQDIEQTNLFELVPLRGQAEYVLSVDLLSMGNQLKRSPAAFLVTGAIGAVIGGAIGGTEMAIALGVAGMAAIPVPTKNRAEAEVRMTLENAHGDVLWQKACYGEFDGSKFVTPLERVDQKLVDAHLTKAVKRANACLLGQLRQFLLEEAGAAE